LQPVVQVVLVFRVFLVQKEKKEIEVLMAFVLLVMA
jgi:hypothetical protein